MRAVILQFHDGIRVRVRVDNGTCSDWFTAVGQGIPQGCNLAPLLILSFAAMFMVAFDDFRKDEEVTADVVKIERTVLQEEGKNA